MWVKPKPDTVVRDPRTRQHMPADGVEMPENDLAFVRLLQDGDLVEAEKPAEPEPKPSADLHPPTPPAAETEEHAQ